MCGWWWWWWEWKGGGGTVFGHFCCFGGRIVSPTGQLHIRRLIPVLLCTICLLSHRDRTSQKITVNIVDQSNSSATREHYIECLDSHSAGPLTVVEQVSGVNRYVTRHSTAYAHAIECPPIVNIRRPIHTLSSSSPLTRRSPSNAPYTLTVHTHTHAHSYLVGMAV